MTTLAHIVTAAQSAELVEQMIAAAAVLHVDAPDLRHWAYVNAQRLVAADVGDGQTVASHHADESLTDAHVLAAVRAVADIVA